MTQTEEEYELLRIPVASHLEPDLRLYRRLYLARMDLEEAKAFAEEMLLIRPASYSDRPPPLLMALMTSLVVSYARPWVYSRGQSIAERAVPGSILRSLTANQRIIHNWLIDQRNQEVAHSDADILNLYLRLYPSTDSAIYKTTREPFKRAELKQIIRIIVKLNAAIDRRCDELRVKLPTHTWI